MALLDVTKAIAMFRKVNIEVLGLVENMSHFICPECKTRHEIFGSGGVRQRGRGRESFSVHDLPTGTRAGRKRLPTPLPVPSSAHWRDASATQLTVNARVPYATQVPRLPHFSHSPESVGL